MKATVKEMPLKQCKSIFSEAKLMNRRTIRAINDEQICALDKITHDDACQGK